MIQFDRKMVEQWISDEELQQMNALAVLAHQQLWDKSLHHFGKGWLDWPNLNHEKLINEIDEIAQTFRSISDVTVVIGIGGSYLGAKSAISMNQFEFSIHSNPSRVIFAGHLLSQRYMLDLLTFLDDHEVTVVVVSKSGGTLEPAVAFHIIQAYMEKRYGERAKERICAVTDFSQGQLLSLARAKKYKILPIPSNIGGRFSVLTAVGLLPMAISGIAIQEVLFGARRIYELQAHQEVYENTSYQYAIIRHLLYLKGFQLEALITYEPSVSDFAKWWQQLFGESQGKNGMGLYPTMMQYTTDLHSMGQYVQDAKRLLFETVLDVVVEPPLHIHESVQGNSIHQIFEGKTFMQLQEIAIASVMQAHYSAGVPNLYLKATGHSAKVYGELVYFFEVACAFGGYLLGVNAFNQPGVEAYKIEIQKRLK